MLSGDNGVLRQAGNAKTQTDIAGEKEILQTSALAAMGKSKYGEITKEKLDDELDKSIGNLNYSSEQSDDGIEVTFTNNGRTYLVDYNGNVEKATPKIAVDENSLTITNTDGSSITKGEVEQGTALKINFNASIAGGTVTISPSLPHTTTGEEIEAKSVTFTITASVSDATVEPIEYIVNLKDIYKSNVVSMEELKANASTYFGYDVINYAETLPSNLQDTKWQLFYAGKLDETDTTEQDRIYLISKEYVKNTVLPTVLKNGEEVEGAKPIPTDGSDYQAKFGNSTSDGVMPEYSGSSDISTNMQKYNRDYFKDYTSTNPNMKAVAYMLDTTTWVSFSTSSKNYAEWAIGGPSIELLFTAYNKYEGTTYEADATSVNGYKFRKTSSDSFSYSLSGVITRGPYSVLNLDVSKSKGYFIASPMAYNKDWLLAVDMNGNVNSADYVNSYLSLGFRPLVLLDSNFQLEKTTSEGKKVFKIVPKTE